MHVSPCFVFVSLSILHTQKNYRIYENESDGKHNLRDIRCKNSFIILINTKAKSKLLPVGLAVDWHVSRGFPTAGPQKGTCHFPHTFVKRDF